MPFPTSASAAPYALAAAAGVATSLGGFATMRMARRGDLLFGLTGGLVIGLALLDLVPAALQSGAGAHHDGIIAACVAAGFAAYMLAHRIPGAAGIGRATLLAHSVMDGLIISLAFGVSNATGWMVALAVLLHDLADGANMVGLSLSIDGGRRLAAWLGANALAPIVGVMLGRTISIAPGEFSPALALFAGGFLYIGTVELLPRSQKAQKGMQGALACITGLTVMGFVTHFAH